ncbi:MAG: PD40 domain-containing protein [Alistipes sp.]|nr:PD40 domain-containing protein [Alistipes sp.]
MKKLFIILLMGCVSLVEVCAQSVDYSVVSVNEETGINFVQITQANDYVCMPIVNRSKKGPFNWLSNRIIDISPDGEKIAYLSARNNTTNIFIKELGRQSGSVQRTNRQAVLDFTYSPDGKQIVFSENRGNAHQIFTTDANVGYVCRQVTSASQDYSPCYTSDMSQILFARMEGQGISIWGHEVKTNILSSYTSGMNPCPTADGNVFLCTRVNGNNRSEIWKINGQTGVEECIVTDPFRSFTTPVLSPNGEWIVFVGESEIAGPGFTYKNTDIYACRVDGTSQLMQLTYHAADDLSPVWSRDGEYIYFISQRGNAAGTANIWRMPFTY